MIRRALPEDTSSLMPMAERFYAMSPWKHVAEYDAASSQAGMAALIGSETAGVFVIDDGERLKGAVGFVCVPVWLSANFTLAQEVFWYVESDVSREAVALWKAGEAWAEASGASAILMIRLEGLRDETLHRLYVRRGYTPVEHHYVRRLG